MLGVYGKPWDTDQEERSPSWDPRRLGGRGAEEADATVLSLLTVL